MSIKPLKIIRKVVVPVMAALKELAVVIKQERVLEEIMVIISFQEMEGDPVNPIPFMTAKPPEFRWQTSGHLASPVILGVRPNNHQRAAVTDGRDRRAEIINKSTGSECE